MRKLSILFISDLGYDCGGMEQDLLAKASGLRNNGHTVKILTSDIDPDSRPMFSDHTFKGADENSLAGWFIRVFNFHAYFALKKILQEFKPDIIHLHNIFHQASPSVLLATGNIPAIMTLHSYEAVCPTGALIRPDGWSCVSPGKHDLRCTGSVRGYIYESVRQAIHRLMLKKILLYIAPSQSLKRDMTGQKMINAPIRLIYDGAILNGYQPLYNYDRILYAGRLSEEKGVEVLIRAFRIISDNMPDIYLDIAGDGPSADNLKALSRGLGLEDRVRFLGRVEKKRVAGLYAGSTLVVVPSICPETFSLTGIEALSSGRPVIGSDIGAIPEWLADGQCGYLSAPGDAAGLAAKALALLRDKALLEKMSAAAPGQAQKFSAEAGWQELEKLYFEIAA